MRMPMRMEFGVALLALAATGSPRAAEPEAGAAPLPSPALERLLRAAPAGEGSVELRGYVGPSPADVVRLHPELSAERYLEIPRSAVLHSTPDGDPALGAVRLHMSGSAVVQSVTRTRAADVDGVPRVTFPASRIALDGVAMPREARARAGYSGRSLGTVCANGRLKMVYESSDGTHQTWDFVDVGSCELW